MENQVSQDKALNNIYDYAVDLLVKQDKNSVEVIDALVAKGLDEESATLIVNNLILKINETRAQSRKDMAYGAMWCLGGITVTAISYSVVAWGAILFGAIQFIKGAINATNNLPKK